MGARPRTTQTSPNENCAAIPSGAAAEGFTGAKGLLFRVGIRVNRGGFKSVSFFLRRRYHIEKSIQENNLFLTAPHPRARGKLWEKRGPSRSRPRLKQHQSKTPTRTPPNRTASFEAIFNAWTTFGVG
jgi:hypothetical protein